MNALVCYEIGINGGMGHVSGSCFITVDRLTKAKLVLVSEELRADFIEKNPHINSVQSVVLRSVTRLDDAEPSF
jgi:hypothetical protein